MSFTPPRATLVDVCENATPVMRPLPMKSICVFVLSVLLLVSIATYLNVRSHQPWHIILWPSLVGIGTLLTPLLAGLAMRAVFFLIAPRLRNTAFSLTLQWICILSSPPLLLLCVVEVFGSEWIYALGSD